MSSSATVTGKSVAELDHGSVGFFTNKQEPSPDRRNLSTSAQCFCLVFFPLSAIRQRVIISVSNWSASLFALRCAFSEFRVLVYFARLLTASVDLRSMTNWNSRAQVPTTRLWVLPGGTKCSPNLFSLHLQHLYGTRKIDTETWHHAGESISRANSSNANGYLVNESNKRDATKTILSGNDYND